MEKDELSSSLFHRHSPTAQVNSPSGLLRRVKIVLAYSRDYGDGVEQSSGVTPLHFRLIFVAQVVQVPAVHLGGNVDLTGVPVHDLSGHVRPVVAMKHVQRRCYVPQ